MGFPMIDTWESADRYKLFRYNQITGAKLICRWSESGKEGEVSDPLGFQKVDKTQSAAEQGDRSGSAVFYAPAFSVGKIDSRAYGREKDNSHKRRSIRALLYSPKDIEENAPCLVYYHGGGFVLPAAPYHYSLAKEYAQKAHCKVLFVDYRLAPKYPFPVAPEDCYAAYSWVLANAKALSVDSARITVAGDSAGGQLATVVCLMARDRGLPMPCGQMMIYPAAGNVDTESVRKYTDTPMCNSKDMEKYGKLYQPDPSVGNNVYASPIEAESLEGLPAAYIETAEFDCLRDGGILYAERLRQFGVSAELYNTEGTMHGFDIVLKSPIVRACVDRRIAFFKQIFGGI